MVDAKLVLSGWILVALTAFLLISCDDDGTSPEDGSAPPVPGPEPVVLQQPYDSDVGFTEVNLRWSLPETRNYARIGVIMVRQPAAPDTVLVAIGEPRSSYFVEGLERSTQYRFRADTVALDQRVAESNVVTVSTNWVCSREWSFNDSWEDVLTNLEGALECGDAAEYMKMLTSSQPFLYEPSATLRSQYHYVFALPWTRDREAIFINDIFSYTHFSANMTLEIISGPTESGNIIDLTARYEIQEIDQNGDPVGILYTDIAELQFLRTGLFVELLLWRDTSAIPDALPFGALRADHGGWL